MSDSDIPKSAIRILVVDDFELWRRHVIGQLSKHTDFVATEASDGLEALRKAEELRPDLILLDVGLPTMDGITVASSVLRAAPRAKILMLSAHNGSAIVHAAFRAGARGYVLKSDAGRELTSAIDALVRGEFFVSRSIASDEPGRHAAQFYSNDDSLTASLCDLVVVALAKRQVVVLVLTQAHRERLNKQFEARGIEISRYEYSGQYFVVDAADTLSSFMSGNVPSAPAFFSQAHALIHRAEAASGAESRDVVIFGEMVDLLWGQGNREAAIQLERWWNELAREHGFRLRCAYSSSRFQPASERSLHAAICAEHSTVLAS